ncbi:alpha/beta hydrolase [Streptomyces sp. NA04227]|uniref:alpha/beta fold hydrolase n=1 Tax=Streptomyces sp. NA04227 TaxID=2742136 RepID=UPI0015918CD8|nr:alpha/beta hydrolase [Streptomyces sp. NA04227]QKW06571.1 alpha/beta hydrolase [Streptomyces sp. NA04227]
MTARGLRRLAHSALGAVAPGAGARWTTDVFSSTRTLGIRPDNVLPIGAREFAVDNSPDAPNGYLWGERSPRGTALLVHGWASDSSSMHSLVTPMRELGFRVAAFDAPAHGVRPGSQATMTQYTRAVGAVLDTLGDVRVIVAHSLGTIASIGAAAQRPGLALHCMAFIAPAATLGGVLERWEGDGLKLNRAKVEGVYAELHRRNGVPVSHWDAVALGPGLDVPKLTLHDPDDDMVPYSDAEAIAAGLTHVRLERAHGVGHIGILMSREVRATVSDFVAEHANREKEGIS